MAAALPILLPRVDLASLPKPKSKKRGRDEPTAQSAATSPPPVAAPPPVGRSFSRSSHATSAAYSVFGAEDDVCNPAEKRPRARSPSSSSRGSSSTSRSSSCRSSKSTCTFSLIVCED